MAITPPVKSALSDERKAASQMPQNSPASSFRPRPQVRQGQGLPKLEIPASTVGSSRRLTGEKANKAETAVAASWIMAFSLPQKEGVRPYFVGDGKKIRDKFSLSIQEMDGLLTDLGQMKIDEIAKTSFLKNLRYCMKALEKLYNKFDFEGCDSDEISEKFTEKFFKIIGEDLLDTIMPAIYRGDSNSPDYRNFLQKVNQYLSKHGIYTKDIIPGELAKGEITANIEAPIFKKTKIESEDGKIAEVELLPYFMAYENDDGDRDVLIKRGRVICLKYGV